MVLTMTTTKELIEKITRQGAISPEDREALENNPLAKAIVEQRRELNKLTEAYNEISPLIPRILELTKDSITLMKAHTALKLEETIAYQTENTTKDLEAIVGAFEVELKTLRVKINNLELIVFGRRRKRN